MKVDVISSLKNEEYWHILNPKIKLIDPEMEASPHQYTRAISTDY